MCGIAGTINLPLDKSDLKIIEHRGPDSNGLFTTKFGDSVISLGHVRLSIVDLTDAGFQPMISDCGNYVLVFNGEIYNHHDLRDDLQEVKFKGHSDSETILYYLIKYGIESVNKFNGIFSFAFLDIKRGVVSLVRDHFGIKPLYYYIRGNRFIFSSEMKLILDKIDEQEIDLDHLYSFIRLRYSPSPQTLFKGIYKLLPGHYITYNIEDNRMSEPFFYSYKPDKTFTGSQAEALEQYDFYLRSAIKRQLMSDVPISILLSGGVDSALLTKVARDVSGNNFATYTAGYKTDSDNDELRDANISASFLGTNHQEVLIKDELFINHLEDFIECIEEPVGSQSIMPLYYLSERIHNDGFKVVLTGQGVDEPWGGYPKYNPQNLMEILSNPLIPKSQLLHKLSTNDQYRRAINGILEKKRVNRFIEVCSVFDRSFIAGLMYNYDSKRGDDVLSKIFRDRFNVLNLNNFKPVDSLMFFDSRMNLADDLLMYTDKISMRHSLEMRVPFLDIDLMRFVESLPYKFKVTLFKNKILHKKIAEKYLSKEIIYRKKKHFETPRKQWFKGKIGKKFEEKILSNDGLFSQIFDRNYIHILFDDHRKNKFNYEKQIYLIISIYLWFQIFVEKNVKITS